MIVQKLTVEKVKTLTALTLDVSGQDVCSDVSCTSGRRDLWHSSNLNLTFGKEVSCENTSYIQYQGSDLEFGYCSVTLAAP